MTALLVAANGGHLSQLVELADRIDGLDPDRLWVTFDSPQSRVLLAGRRTVFVPPVEERDLRGVVRDAAYARRILRDNHISAVISTGSGIALSFLPYAAARSIAAHYVESAARVGRPSLTGRILQWVPTVRLYAQYPHLARGRWRFAGSVFDGYQSAAGKPKPVKRMVVTLGTGLHGFRRLIDRLLTQIPSDVAVLWQTGSTPVEGLGIDARTVVPADELASAIADADVVVAHAGCGSALGALNAGKYPVLVPREPQRGELVDNHQVELARFLAERDLARQCSASAITWSDIVAASERRVSRRANPPPLRLAA